MSLKFVQTPPIALYTGMSAAATSCVVTPYPRDIQTNTKLTFADFGTTPSFTVDPKISGYEEICTFTGLTDNGDETGTLTGLTRNLIGQSPYTTPGTGRQHGAGAVIVFSDNPQMYSRLAAKENDEIITGLWTFSQFPITPSNVPATTTTLGLVKVTATPTSAGSPIAVETTDPRVPVAYAVDSVGTDSYAISPSPSITAYAAGQIFTFKAGTANTGAATLNVSGLGAKTIKKAVISDLDTGDILVNQIVQVEYDGTNMQMASFPSTLITNSSGNQFTIPLGESFTGGTTPQPATIINDIFQSRLTGTYVVGGTSGAGAAFNQKLTCSIVPRTNITSSSITALLAKVGSPADNIQITIQTDSAGSPSGTPIANGTSTGITGASLSSSAISYANVSFSSPFSLTANTKYWIVLERTSTENNTNYYIIGGLKHIGAANDYASFVGKSYNNNTWTDGTGFNSPGMPYFKIIPTDNGSLSLWQSDADTTPEYMRNFMGFVNTTGSAGTNGTIYTSGTMVGFSSLIPNLDYYTSTTKGTITTTPGGQCVGTAKNTTQLSIPNAKTLCDYSYGVGGTFTTDSMAGMIWEVPFDGKLITTLTATTSSVIIVSNDSAGTVNAVTYTIQTGTSDQKVTNIPIRKGQYIKISSGTGSFFFIPTV